VEPQLLAVAAARTATPRPRCFQRIAEEVDTTTSFTWSSFEEDFPVEEPTGAQGRAFLEALGVTATGVAPAAHVAFLVYEYRLERLLEAIATVTGSGPA
jgi:hypothetical protein